MAGVQPIQLKLRTKDGKTELTVGVSWRTATSGVSLAKKPSRPTEEERILRAVTVQINGKVVVETQLSESVADLPQFAFTFSGVQSGDRFLVSCVDDMGKMATGEVVSVS